MLLMYVKIITFAGIKYLLLTNPDAKKKEKKKKRNIYI